MNANQSYDNSIWQDFCYDLIEAKKQDVLEDSYQDIIEAGLRQLGWSKVKGEICPKERINIGSNNQLEPDITLKINSKSVSVIEVKRPSNKITQRQQEQLLSYIRMRHNAFGLYIGDEIQLYYDDGNNLPIMVWKTELSLNSQEGQVFVDLFHRNTFNENRIINFCKERCNELKTNTIMASFTQSLAANQDNAIRNALIEYFVDFKKCDRNLVQSILESYHFSSNQATNDTNTSAIPQSNGIIIATNSNTKTSKNTTKYSLDGGKTKLGKGKFVREVISEFLKQNPSLAYNQIKQIFPDYMQGSYGVIRTVEELNNSTHNKTDLFTRYETKAPLISADGVQFVVCNQWGTYNFSNILNLINKWGWSIISD